MVTWGCWGVGCSPSFEFVCLTKSAKALVFFLYTPPKSISDVLRPPTWVGLLMCGLGFIL